MRKFLAAAAVAVAFAAGADEHAPSIKIGVIGPFTGGSSSMGLSMRNGVRLAAREINGQGGVLGRSIELVERDDEASPEKGVQVARELVKEKVAAVVGFINTGVALAAQKHFQDARIPVLTNVSSGAILTRQFLPPRYPDNYIFRNSASDAVQAEMVVREAIERRKFRKVAILADVTAYGQQGRELMEKALAGRGITPVAIERFKIGEADMSAQLERARRAGAEVLLGWGSGPELAAIASGRARLGWKVPIVGGWTLSLDNFITRAGANGNGARMPQTFIAEPTTSRHAAFIANYLDTYKVQRIPSAVSAAQGYDSLLLVAAAIRQAHSTEGPKIHAALEDLKERVEGIVATYERPFTRQDHEAIAADMVVTGEVRDGVVTYAYKEDEKAASIGRKRGN
ncbi:MAG: ABC transporter substrate-binding protein [Pseudomonadota bacterium]|jgi:branched-chain amino acid transport system substrate-binding protein